MRLNSKVSPDDAEYAPTQQKEETDRFAPPDQSVPFLMESSLFESRAVAHNSENRSLREAPLPKSWPSGPRSLRERGSSTYASYLWDAIVTLFPVIFLVLGVSALRLDDKPRSLFGDRIIEASKYGTTAFPIIFAVIVARLMRAIALWRCEAGSRLGLLEQLNGSQSLGGTVERVFLLRRFDISGILIVLLWFLSPVGSQLSLSLLTMKDTAELAQAQIRYFNTTISPDELVSADFSSGSTMNSLQATLTGLVTTSMLASDEVKNSTVDQWNNVKIPYLEKLTELPSPLRDNPWIPIDREANKTWVSMSGLMIQDLSSDRVSSFLVDTAYLDVFCSDVIDLPIENTGKILPSPLVNNLTSTNLSFPFTSDEKWSSLFVDTNTENAHSLEMPLSLVYGSCARNIDTRSDSTSSSDGSIQAHNCSVTYPKVQGNVSCNGTSCGVTHMRRAAPPDASPQAPPFLLTEYMGLLHFIPGSLGFPHDGSISAIEQYTMGSDAPMAVPVNQGYVHGFAGIPGSVFARRLTTVLNTAWQAGMCPFGISLGASVEFDGKSGLQAGCKSATATANTTKVIKQARYAVSNERASCLLAITLVLQACAFAGLALRLVTRAPDILGYISTLTRDKAHFNIPHGGNTWTGVQRARYLANVKVGLRDVRPEEEVGHIVFSTLDGHRNSEAGRLNSKRTYW